MLPLPQAFFPRAGSAHRKFHQATRLVRGVNMDTFYYALPWNPNAAWEYADQQDIAYLADLGVTSIRLAVHWRYFETTLGYDLIDAYLEGLVRAGGDVCGAGYARCASGRKVVKPAIWTDPAVQQQMLDLWAEIAQLFWPVMTCSTSLGHLNPLNGGVWRSASPRPFAR